MTTSTGNVPGRIFMSYRREDTAFPAGWLYDRLASHFRRDQVFKDIDSIELGDDFIEVMTTAVGSCDVLLALIGGRWLTITGQDGRRRLDNPGDFVRLEIEVALARNVRVIPILVDGARMPGADELPSSLAKLTRRQALELSPNRFDTDIRRLLRVLDRTVADAQEQARQEADRAARQRRQVEQLQGQVRERAAAQDWDAVVAASEELAGLDPAAADPDGLASAAREQITRRQEAEPMPSGAQQPADDQLTEFVESPQDTAGEQGLTPTGQAGAGPVVGPGTAPGGVDHGVASKAGDDHHPVVTDVPSPSLGEEPTPATGLRLAGHVISRRLVVIAAAGIAVIGLVTAIIITSTNGANGPTASGPTAIGPTASGPTASQRWAYTTGGLVDSSPAVAGGTVYVGSDDNNVYALDAATGDVRWTYTTGDQVDSSPAVAGGTVYVGSNDHKVYALDATTGHIRWTYTTGDAISGQFGLSAPAVVDGTVYIGSNDNNVYALDAATGHVRWTYTTGNSVETKPAVVDGTVYIGSLDNNVYALDAATGHIRWTYTTGKSIYSSPAVASGTVYVGSDDHKVYALNTATGHIRRTYTTGDSVDSSPAVASGTVYIGSWDTGLYALKATASLCFACIVAVDRRR
jgi:outer membrane protein assembly factor BamB